MLPGGLEASAFTFLRAGCSPGGLVASSGAWKCTICSNFYCENYFFLLHISFNFCHKNVEMDTNRTLSNLEIATANLYENIMLWVPENSVHVAPTPILSWTDFYCVGHDHKGGGGEVQGARPLGEHAGRDGGGVPCSLQGKHRKISPRLLVVVGIHGASLQLLLLIHLWFYFRKLVYAPFNLHCPLLSSMYVNAITGNTVPPNP